MSGKKAYIDFNLLDDLLAGDSSYVKEFCEAGVVSFKKFRDEYKEYLLARDIENLKKTGHRIKPVVQMLAVEQVIKEYQRAKQMLVNDKNQKDLQESVNKIDTICDQIIREFREKLKDI